MGRKNKPKYNTAQNVWFMLKLAYTSREKKVIVLCLLSGTLAAALTILNLYVSPAILSALEKRAAVPELICTITGFVLGIMLISAASAYVDQNTLYGRVSVRSEIINLINIKGATTSYPNTYNDKFIGLLKKAFELTQSNIASTEAIWDTLTKLITNIIVFAICLSLLSVINPLLIAVIILTTVINYFISRYTDGYIYRHKDEEKENLTRLEYIHGIAKDFSAAKDIRIFGLRPWFEELFNKALGVFTAFYNKAQGVRTWGKIADLILAFLRNAAAYAYLIGNVINNGMSVSDFLLCFNAVGRFTEQLTNIFDGLNTLHKQSLDISMIRELLEFDEPFKFEGGKRINRESCGKYEITLENVSFRYPGADKDTLTNINLTLHHGEKLAVVGLNGVGKTTLIKLICGFLEPNEGRVLLNGEDIRVFNRFDYYDMFSAVFQNFSVIAGTIAVNIAQTDENIDTERVKNCADKAGLSAKIESLPKGYETNLNREIFEDAVALSGGETQRLMLARALYKDAPFIILDEPTAALDPIAEADIYQKYNEMTYNKSSVYISHRLASTRFCDRIIMLDNSEICETGTHDELLKLGGKYSELFKVQSKYYKEGCGNE